MWNFGRRRGKRFFFRRFGLFERGAVLDQQSGEGRGVAEPGPVGEVAAGGVAAEDHPVGVDVEVGLEVGERRHHQPFGSGKRVPAAAVAAAERERQPALPRLLRRTSRRCTRRLRLRRRSRAPRSAAASRCSGCRRPGRSRSIRPRTARRGTVSRPGRRSGRWTARRRGPVRSGRGRGFGGRRVRRRWLSSAFSRAALKPPIALQPPAQTTTDQWPDLTLPGIAAWIPRCCLAPGARACTLAWATVSFGVLPCFFGPRTLIAAVNAGEVVAPSFFTVKPPRSLPPAT